MKRILLGMVLMISTLSPLIAQSFYIDGDYELREDDIGYYRVESRGNAEIASVSWDIGTSFDLDTGSLYENGILLKAMKGSAGKAYIYATVMDGKMYSHYLTFEVNIKPPAVIEDVKYKSLIGLNEEATFSVSLTNSNDYYVTWNYDNEYFDFVYEALDKNTTILKAKKLGSTTIGIVARSKMTGSYTHSRMIIVNIEMPYKINTNVNTACCYSLVSYNIAHLTNSMPSNAIITWQTGQNMTLISGQGTTTATYKASGEGQGVVKAKITYKGEDFEIENSDVQIQFCEPTITTNYNYNALCVNSTITYKVNNVPDDANITWFSPENMTLVSGQGTQTAVFRGSGEGYGSAYANIKFGTYDKQKRSSSIWVGPPQASLSMTRSYMANGEQEEYFMEGSTSVCLDDRPFVTPPQYGSYHKYRVRAYVHGGMQNSNWQKLSSVGQINIQYPDHIEFTPQTGKMEFMYTVSNTCGGTTERITIDAKNCQTPGGGKPSNPGGNGGEEGGWDANEPDEPVECPIDDDNAEATLKSSFADAPKEPVNIKVYSFTTGSLVYQKKNVTDFNIQSISLKEGIYIIETTGKGTKKTIEKVYKKNNNK